jgi:hypothetical protein
VATQALRRFLSISGDTVYHLFKIQGEYELTISTLFSPSPLTERGLGGEVFFFLLLQLFFEFFNSESFG